MPASPIPSRRLIVIDDDMLTREVLTLLAAEAGFEVAAYDSGESALESLPHSQPPHAILADMQMSGVSGDALARRLRAACGPATTLLAMSGSRVPAARARAFDGFLLKPFTAEDLTAALANPASEAPEPDSAGILSESIFAAFAQSLSPVQLHQLYAMSLDDADSRIPALRAAAAANDAAAYRRAAHAIKGGCALVGAVQLARLAGRMEEHGPPVQKTTQTIDNPDPCDEFLAASAHLRRILEAQLKL